METISQTFITLYLPLPVCLCCLAFLIGALSPVISIVAMKISVTQVRNQLGATGEANNFLRGAQIF